MWLELANTNARIIKSTQSEKSWLAEYLSFRNAGAFFKRRKKVRMLNEVTDTFPTGFVPMIQRAVAKLPPEETFPIEIIDQRVAPVVPIYSPDDIEWLRHHPQATIDPITHQIDAL